MSDINITNDPIQDIIENPIEENPIVETPIEEIKTDEGTDWMMHS